MKAMILAAGRGERMRPLTDTTPKPLLRAGGKPLIVWHIERLVTAGINEIVINHAHLGQLIEATLGDGTQYGAHIRYSRETQALETAGGIATALSLLGQEPFLVINGDIYSEFDLSQAQHIARTLQTTDLAHLILIPNPPHHPTGDFVLSGSRIRNDHHDPDSRLTFSGIGIYRAELFAKLAAHTSAKLAPLLINAIDHDTVSGERFDGYWIDVGTPQRLTELDRKLAAKRR